MRWKFLLQDKTYGHVWRWLKEKTHGHRVIIVFLAILILVGLAIKIINTSAWPQWTGLGTKTAWDLADLLLVPLVLVIGAFLLNRAQCQSELDIAAEERDTERQITKDREEERALQSYLEAMTKLLLDKELRASEEGSEVRSIARSRTLTVLRSLNGERKGSVLRFLYEAKLIGNEMTVVLLDNANLEGAWLIGDYLEGANLEGAALEGAHLPGANLRGANLKRAYLKGANLGGANLREANLGEAYLMEANLWRANLWGANLEGAHLEGARLREAYYKSVTRWPKDFTPPPEAINLDEEQS